MEASMTLQQFHSLKVWHTRQGDRHPVEKTVWDAVLTVWVMGWVGLPVALLIHAGWVEIGALSVLFLPGSYVAARLWLHRRRRLRCDWAVALR
jgi:hypothetical protein